MDFQPFVELPPWTRIPQDARKPSSPSGRISSAVTSRSQAGPALDGCTMTPRLELKRSSMPPTIEMAGRLIRARRPRARLSRALMTWGSIS